MAGSVACLLLFGAAVVAVSSHGPCWFDPPPGDQFSRSITNDTPSALTLVYCDDERCRTGYREEDVAAGASAEVVVGGCSTETLAVTDSHTSTVAACLTEYGDELPNPAGVSDLRMSQGAPCPGSNPPFTIRTYDPDR